MDGRRGEGEGGEGGGGEGGGGAWDDMEHEVTYGLGVSYRRQGLAYTSHLGVHGT